MKHRLPAPDTDRLETTLNHKVNDSQFTGTKLNQTLAHHEGIRFNAVVRGAGRLGARGDQLRTGRQREMSEGF